MCFLVTTSGDFFSVKDNNNLYGPIPQLLADNFAQVLPSGHLRQYLQLHMQSHPHARKIYKEISAISGMQLVSSNAWYRCQFCRLFQQMILTGQPMTSFWLQNLLNKLIDSVTLRQSSTNCKNTTTEPAGLRIYLTGFN